uniref:Putative mucin 19 n=1 Tax=Anopheles marajoara TaxID=58244 RepID=A0A2M4BHJ3_9DIPT
MDVTLIVKASNQQCEDLTIKCEPSWTIRRLKGHLTEVYPGKPSTDEQKLIYSGQLLSDSVVLKDVLRQYEGQQAHTVHLVFTPKNHYYGSNSTGNTSGPSKSSTAGSMSTSHSQGTGSSSSSSSSPVTSNGTSNDAPAQSAQTARERDSELEQQLASSLSASDREGLRQRITRPALRTLPGPPAFMQETAALQNLVQQSYMQYLNQYINLLNAGQNNVNALYSPSGVLPPMGGTGTASLQTLTGTSDSVATVPTVPINHTAPVAISGLPTAYYPCMMPSGSGIPTSMGAAGSFIAPTSLSSPSLATSSPATATPTAPAQTPFSAPAGPSSSSSATHSDAGSPSPLATGGETSANTAAAAAVATAAAPSQAAEQEAVAGGEVPAGGAAAAVPAARAARRFPNIVVEEQDNNDWLDVFFSMCRVLILMTVIYLYSSPMRCLTVLVIGVMLYLKKHFDRIYQAVDRRVMNAAGAAVPGVQQNNVPEAPLLQQNAPDMGEHAPAAAPAAAAAAEENNQPERSARTDASPSGTSSSSSSSRSSLPRPRTEQAASNQATEVPVAPEQREPVGTEVTASNSMEEVAAEGQRMTFNDMTSFLGTLVITFFTSIIPDTPAA